MFLDIKIPSHFKRILITGGSGFIGGCLIRNLLQNSDIKIFNLDKGNYASNPKNLESILFKENTSFNDKYELLEIDLFNKQLTYDAVEKANPDLVLHFAAESHVDRSINNPQEFINSNIIGTFNLLEAVLAYWNKLPINKKELFRMHHVSTDEVYGSLSADGFFDENTSYKPRSPYSASKASSDHLVNAWHHTFELPVVITNCSNNYGPWQHPEKLIPTIILKAISKEPIPIYGDGQNIRDWLFVEDHIEAILTAAIKGKIGRTYCIGGNAEKSNKEVVEKICRLLDQKLTITGNHHELITYVEDRPGHDKRYAINFSRIREELRWQPKHNFTEGLDKTIDWYIANAKWCKYMYSKSKYKGERLGLL